MAIVSETAGQAAKKKLPCSSVKKIIPTLMNYLTFIEIKKKGDGSPKFLFGKKNE